MTKKIQQRNTELLPCSGKKSRESGFRIEDFLEKSDNF
jgi:hypothetical protein